MSPPWEIQVFCCSGSIRVPPCVSTVTRGVAKGRKRAGFNATIWLGWFGGIARDFGSVRFTGNPAIIDKKHSVCWLFLAKMMDVTVTFEGTKPLGSGVHSLATSFFCVFRVIWFKAVNRHHVPAKRGDYISLHFYSLFILAILNPLPSAAALSAVKSTCFLVKCPNVPSLRTQWRSLAWFKRLLFFWKPLWLYDCSFAGFQVDVLAYLQKKVCTWMQR